MKTNESASVKEVYKELKQTRFSKEYISGMYIQQAKKNFKKFKFLKAFKSYINSLKKSYEQTIMYCVRNNPTICNDIDFQNKKIAVYTCVTGGYDNIQEPLFVSDNVDYILFTDNKTIKSDKWIVKDIPDELKDKYSGNLPNRYLKLHPFEYLSDYDYALYIDGNVQVISDIHDILNSLNLEYGISLHMHSIRCDVYKEAKKCIKLKKGNKKKIRKQIKSYSKEEMPKNYGLLEATVILSEISNEKAKKIFNDWWNEYLTSESFRDQLSLPYVLWKNNIKIESIGTLGNSVYANEHFYITPH